MRHSKATLRTSQDCDDDEGFGPKGVLRDFHSAGQSRGRGQIDPAHGADCAIQRDLNKLKSVVNIPHAVNIPHDDMTTEVRKHVIVDPTKQKKKAALLRALHCLT